MHRAHVLADLIVYLAADHFIFILSRRPACWMAAIFFIESNAR
jgi:hypothetical protein